MWILGCVVSIGVALFGFGADVPASGVTKESQFDDLKGYFGPVPAYLARGVFDERRRIPTDDSYTLDDVGFGSMRIRGLGKGSDDAARSWLKPTLVKSLVPPSSAEFRAYRRLYRREGDVDDRHSECDGYDTVVVHYSCGDDRIQIAQTICVLALTIEGPNTQSDLDGPLDSLSQQAKTLTGQYLILRDEPVFEGPRRFSGCVAARRAKDRPTSQPEDQRRAWSAATQSMSGDLIVPRYLGWWCDGKRFGFLCFKPSHPLSGRGAGVAPCFNRCWFNRPVGLEDARRMAAEYRASTAPAKTQE